MFQSAIRLALSLEILLVFEYFMEGIYHANTNYFYQSCQSIINVANASRYLKALTWAAFF